MIEIWFPSKEEADEAADDLSDFGRPERRKRTETFHDRSEYLSSTYEEAVEKLEELSESEEESEEDSKRARLLTRALSVTKSLFESGDHEEILEAETREEAEDRLCEVAEDLEEYGELRERVEKSMEEYMEASREEGAEVEFPDEASEDLEEYSLSRNFLVEPVLDSVFRYGGEDDPLEKFTDDVHLEVTPVTDWFEDVEKTLELKSQVVHGLKLDVEHVLHHEEVLDRLKGRNTVNPPEEIFYGFLSLGMIAGEILSTVRGRKKANYQEFVDEVVESVNNSVREGKEEKILLNTTRDTVEHLVKGLKRAGYVRKKGNKISEV